MPYKKIHLFVKTRCIIPELQGLKYEQFHVHLLKILPRLQQNRDGDGEGIAIANARPDWLKG